MKKNRFNFDWIDAIDEKNADAEDVFTSRKAAVFDEDIVEEENLELTPRQIKRIEKAKFARLGREENLRDILQALNPPGPPRPGESVHIVANKFHLWSCVPVLLGYLKKVDALYSATWSIAMPQARELVEMLQKGKIGKAYFITGVYMKRREPVVYAYLAENMAEKGGVKCFETHVKILLLANEKKGDYYSIESSANLTDNPRLEFFTIYNDRGIYEHHKAWMDEAFRMKSERYVPW